jgi:hypothetical protein
MKYLVYNSRYGKFYFMTSDVQTCRLIDEDSLINHLSHVYKNSYKICTNEVVVLFEPRFRSVFKTLYTNMDYVEATSHYHM